MTDEGLKNVCAYGGVVKVFRGCFGEKFVFSSSSYSRLCRDDEAGETDDDGILIFPLLPQKLLRIN